MTVDDRFTRDFRDDPGRPLDTRNEIITGPVKIGRAHV